MDFQGDQERFVMGVYGPTVKCLKHLEGTNVKNLQKWLKILHFLGLANQI